MGLPQWFYRWSSDISLRREDPVVCFDVPVLCSYPMGCRWFPTFSLIAAAGEDGACVFDLIEPVRLSQPTVSHHMRQLVDAGLITREQRGKWAYYRLVDGALAAVAGTLGTA